MNMIAAPARLPVQLSRTIAMNWPVTEIHGWGLSGLHIALSTLDAGYVPVLAAPPLLDSMRDQVRARLEPWLGVSDRFRDYVASVPGGRVALSDVDVLAALNDQLGPGLDSQALRGARNIGVAAFCDTTFPREVIDGLAGFDRIIVHSSFNARILADHGVTRVTTCLQGVDPTEAAPGPRRGLFAGRFVVFSGGKLEYRKGQDIVVAAFRVFQQRHPDALLVTAWANLWPHIAATVAQSPLVSGPPSFRADGTIDLDSWLAAQGLPAGSFLNLGLVRRDALAPLLHECDLAVFPNRCEPGTNIVAMEVMACGVPVVLSANTGHLDIAAPDRSMILGDQRPVAGDPARHRHWGESNVEEVVAAMEQAYADRDRTRAIGQAGAEYVLRHHTWSAFGDNVLRTVAAVQ